MRLALLCAAFFSACTPSPPIVRPAGAARPAADTVRADWARFFEAEGGTGTFVLLDVDAGRTSRLDPARAARRYVPASTFKVFNALVALETGVVTDPDSTFVWDGETRDVAAWNRDHTLRSGMAFSVVWLYQRIARDVGRERYLAAFARQPYGTGTVGPDVDLFWLDNSLQVSADEQVAFMVGLRRGTLAFRPDVQATVRDLLPLLIETPGARLVGKTGWGGFDGAPPAGAGQAPVRTQLGWLVGWVEKADGHVAVFALNVEPARDGLADADLRFEMGPARLRIARALLTAEGWL